MGISKVLVVFGVIVGLVVTLVVVSQVGGLLFQRSSKREVAQLFSTVSSTDDVVTEADLVGLPASVQ